MTLRAAGGAVAGLLLAEYLLLSLCFDVYDLRQSSGPWALVGWFGRIAPMFAVAAVFGVAFARPDRTGISPTERWKPPARLAARILLHVGVYLGVWLLTPRLSGSFAYTIAWVALVALLLATALGLIMTWSDFVRVVPQTGWWLAISIGVAGLAFVAATLAERAWPFMLELTLSASAALLLCSGEDVHLEPDRQLLGARDFVVEVTSACSGIEGVGLAVVFVGAYVLFDRKQLRLPGAWVAVPIAVGLVLAANTFRIAALVWLGARGFEEVALGGFHSKAGWVLFTCIAVGTTAWTRRAFERPVAPETSREPTERESVTDDAALLLAPLLVLIGTSLVAGLFVVDGSTAYPWAVIAGIAALAYAVPRLSPGTLGSPAWIPSIAYGVLAYVAWMALLAEPDVDGARRAAAEGPSSPLWILARVIGSVLVVPAVEELAFRGFLLRRIAGGDLTRASWRRLGGAVAVSSVVFGFLHQDVTAGVAAGAIYGGVYASSRRLSDAIVAHTVTNGLIAVNVLAQGAWWLWL